MSGWIKQGGGPDSARRPCVCHLCPRGSREYCLPIANLAWLTTDQPCGPRQVTASVSVSSSVSVMKTLCVLGSVFCEAFIHIKCLENCLTIVYSQCHVNITAVVTVHLQTLSVLKVRAPSLVLVTAVNTWQAPIKFL